MQNLMARRSSLFYAAREWFFYVSLRVGELASWAREKPTLRKKQEPPPWNWSWQQLVSLPVLEILQSPYRDDIDRSGRVVACMTAVWEDSGLNLTELVLPSGNSPQQYAVLVTPDIAHYDTTRCHPQIKPEAHNILHCRQNRIDPRPQVITYTENFAEFVCVVFDIRERRDRHTDTLVAIFRTSIWGEVIVMWLCCIADEISLNL